MCEPVSILANVGAIVELVKFAHGFAKDIDSFTHLQPDQELIELASEVRNFGSACDVVHERLEAIGKLSSVTGAPSRAEPLLEPTLTACLEETIVDCYRTMKQLKSEFETIQGRRFRWDKTVRLLRRRNAISDIRRRLHSHVLALQLVLQSISMYALRFVYLRSIA